MIWNIIIGVVCFVLGLAAGIGYITIKIKRSAEQGLEQFAEQMQEEMEKDEMD